jgi:hypothetical protein
MTTTSTPSEAVTGVRRHRLTAPLAVAGLVLAASLALVVLDPNKGHLPICPLKATTGLDCPGCGGLRCVHDLATGHPAAAANQNVLAVVLFPFLIAWWGVWLFRRWRGDLRPVSVPSRVIVTVLVLAAIFGIVRNLPFVPYLRSGLG